MTNFTTKQDHVKTHTLGPNIKSSFKRVVSEAHTAYLNNVVGDSLKFDGKRFWTYIKSKRKERTGIPTLRTNNGVHVTNQSKANALNNQFASVFTRAEKVQSPDRGPSPYMPISDMFIDEKWVNKQLHQLKVNKASGPDDISARMLHDYADEISPMLTNIFQLSYNIGEIDWSKARVTGIYKKGDKTSPENYRPVSLTCICCKIQEHIILSHLAKHLSSQNIIIDNQHGFREKLLCETQLIQAVDDWARTLNMHGQSDVLFLDFNKAFDKVPHECLLHKLLYYGVTGKNQQLDKRLPDRQIPVCRGRWRGVGLVSRCFWGSSNLGLRTCPISTIHQRHCWQSNIQYQTIYRW